MGANAVTTVPVYTAGEVLTAADLNITNSGIPVFATTVTRDAAFGGAGEKTLAQGQTCYIEATSSYQTYTGSAWAAFGASKIAQVVSTTKTDAFSTTSTSYVDVTGMSVTITPTSATSTILVMTGLALSVSSAQRAMAQLVRGATNIAISTGFVNNQTSTGYDLLYQSQYVSINHIDSPATTSATTYKFQVKNGGGGTVLVNAQGGNTDFGNVSTLTVMEILA
jgi:hypothetical protein